MLVNKTKWWLFIPNIINIGWDCWKCLLVSQCFACWCCSANDSKLPAARPWQAHVPVLTTYTSAWNANDGNGVLDWLVWSLDWTASCCWQRQLVCHLLSWVMWRCIVICVCVWYMLNTAFIHCFIVIVQWLCIPVTASLTWNSLRVSIMTDTSLTIFYTQHIFYRLSFDNSTACWPVNSLMTIDLEAAFDV